MTNAGDANVWRQLLWGNKTPVSKASGAFAADTRSIFTVAGGRVMILALWGEVTTAMTVANTVALQHNPSGSGDTVTLVTATDLGTTDTAAGTIVGVGGATQTAAPSFVRGGHMLSNPLICQAGNIEQLTTGTGPDGAITWYCYWLPIDTGATLVAA